VRRFLASAALVISACVTLRAEDSLSRYGVVDIKSCTTSIYIATVTMTMPPFVRKGSVYSSTYSAKVFPYFLFNEKGRIWMTVSDDDLRRASKGQEILLSGYATSDSGDERRVAGKATPTGPTSGKIRVRVFVTRRISLVYDTTYELRGPPPTAK
jgi:hypothetical protein